MCDITRSGSSTPARYFAIAAVLLLLLASSARAAETVPLSESEAAAVKAYADFLAGLDQTDIDAPTKAAEYYQKAIVPLSQAVRDQAFVEFLKFFTLLSGPLCQSLLYDLDADALEARAELAPPLKGESLPGETYIEIHEGVAVPADSEDAIRARVANDPPLVRRLRHHGLAFDLDDGSYWLCVHRPAFVNTNFLPYLSRSLREYVLLRNLELFGLYVADGTLCVSLEENSRRIAVWEKYLHDFPNSLLREEAKYLLRVYFRFFVGPVHDSAFGNPEYPKAWKLHAEQHPDTITGRFLSRYLKAMEENDSRPGEWSEGLFNDLWTDLKQADMWSDVEVFMECVYKPTELADD